jgi:hypothetical protein
MSVLYKHTQLGTLTVLSVLGGIFLIIVLGYSTWWHPIAFIVLVVLLACLALFYSLAVEISHDNLTISFGIGIIRKRFKIRDVVNAYPVRNRWYYGWGIRMTPHGWLFNVSGLDAVEIEMSSGKRYRIGTDQPMELAQAINAARELAA